VAVAYNEESTPIACGAIRPFDETSVELKRMYVRKGFRGRGAAFQVLCYFEVLSKKLGFKRCILETGVRQLPAIKLYERNGFTRIPGYGPYANVPGSICMEKVL
jgi:GNAT superfamily N-acetyltransferase